MPPRGVRVGVLAFAGPVVLAAAIGLAPPAARPAPPSLAARVAIFGVDAADWLVIDRLVAAGRLPAFARLERAGSIGVLRADPPLLSPIIWTTIATGRPPDEHGVLDFMVDTPGGGQAPVNGGSRRTKAMWEIWSEAGRNAYVTGWWATWPADHVRGLMISDRVTAPHGGRAVQPDTGLVYPPGLWPDLVRAVVAPEAIDLPTLARLIPVTRAEFDAGLAADRTSPAAFYRDPIAHFRAVLATTRSYRHLSTARLRDVRPDLWAVYYEIVDTASHLFSRDRGRGDQAIAAAYAEVDEALEEAARSLDPDTLLVVVSDHGFQPADAGIREDPSDLTAGATAWHRPYGIIAAVTAGAMTGRSPDPRFGPLGTVSPLDVLPTLLARAGLPLAKDMPGRVIPALAPASLADAPRVATYGAHVLPASAGRAVDPAARAELERLRALGYVSGTAPQTSLARVNLGEVLFRKGDVRGAARELEAVVRADPLNERASLWLARSYAALGRADEALRVYDRLIQANRTTGSGLDPIVFLAATDLDLGAGRANAARARLDRVPPSLTRTPDVSVARGALAEAERRIPDAEREYRAALQVAPSDTVALERLVDMLIRDARPRAAETAATAAGRAYPASPTHLSLAGEAALAARHYKGAEAWFASALALAPDAASVQVELARARLLDGRPDAALAALAGATSSRDVEMVRGAALAARREWAAAIDCFERALAGAPPTTGLLNALGNAQREAGRTADAIRTFERSLAFDPEQPAVRALLEKTRKETVRGARSSLPG